MRRGDPLPYRFAADAARLASRIRGCGVEPSGRRSGEKSPRNRGKTTRPPSCGTSPVATGRPGSRGHDGPAPSAARSARDARSDECRTGSG